MHLVPVLGDDLHAIRNPNQTEPVVPLETLSSQNILAATTFSEGKE